MEAKDRDEFNHKMSAINQASKLVELTARLKGQLEDNREINIFINPTFVKMRTIILQELDEYPDLKYRIAEVLSHVDD
jgi:hypothetical protein